MCMSRQYTTTSPLRIGTRGSPLALAQAEEVRDRLMTAHGLPVEAFEIVVITTSGDAIQDRPLSEVGGKGLFTKEIEAALFDSRIDVAVHSTKDVATTLPEGLEIATYLPREDVRDAFVSLKYHSIDELPEGAIVGTSSIRRRAQLLARRPDLKTVEFRGNVQTRLRKLNDGVAEATFLASAGLNRLGMADKGIPIPSETMLSAPAQGAIGIETRISDSGMSEFLAPLHDPETALAVEAERQFLRELDGDCRSPIAALARIENGTDLHLSGEILRLDGSEVHHGEWTGPVNDYANIAIQAARELKSKASEGFFGG